VDKPLIQFQPSRDSDGADGVLEMEWKEANHSGIQNIIIVTGRGKTAIEDHFDVSFELEQTLEAKGKKDLLAIVRGVSDMLNVAYVRQDRDANRSEVAGAHGIHECGQAFARALAPGLAHLIASSVTHSLPSGLPGQTSSPPFRYGRDTANWLSIIGGTAQAW